MKKILNVLRSMKFGIILLALIGILCILATVFEFDSIYSSWYFIALFLLLALNLFFCSIVRVKNIPLLKKGFIAQATNNPVNFKIENQEEWLKSQRFKKKCDVYFKNTFGFYGTFLTHLAMLLLTVAAACIFEFTVSTEYVIPVGTTKTLEDGTQIAVKSFSMEGEDNSVEYKSVLLIKTPDGSTNEYDVTVNHPINFENYKLYQQNYVYSAVLGVKVGVSDEEIVRLDEPSFLSLDDENGIFYASLFTNVVEEDDEVKVTQSSELINPAYEINIIQGEDIEPKLAFPGSSIEIDGVKYTFYDPETNPGLLIKEQPKWALILLYFSFVLMLVGLYGCFFCIPEVAIIKKAGISLICKKNTEERIIIYMNNLSINKEKENK